MTHHAMHRLYQTVTRAAQRRDQIEIRSINRLLAPLAQHGSADHAERRRRETDRARRFSLDPLSR